MLLVTCSVTRFRFMLRMCFLPSFSPIRQLPSYKTTPWRMQAGFLFIYLAVSGLSCGMWDILVAACKLLDAACGI